MSPFLYWHAVQKMRIGQFAQAQAIFWALHDKFKHIDSLLGYIYCLTRQEQYEKAKKALILLPVVNANQAKVVARLERRIEGELHG